jgi:hypothetical protein
LSLLFQLPARRGCHVRFWAISSSRKAMTMLLKGGALMNEELVDARTLTAQLRQDGVGAWFEMDPR